MNTLPRSLLSLTLIFTFGQGVVTPARSCGDKFLFTGEALAASRTAVLEPGRILLFRNPTSEVGRAVMTEKLRETLLQVGHTVDLVENSRDLGEALGGGEYDVVLADLADVEALEESASASALHTVLLPVVYQAPWTRVTALRRVYRLVLNAPGHASRIVALVDEAVDLSRAAG